MPKLSKKEPKPSNQASPLPLEVPAVFASEPLPDGLLIKPHLVNRINGFDSMLIHPHFYQSNENGHCQHGFDPNLIYPHFHGYLEIGYCHQGKGFFQLQKTLVPFSQGSVSVIGPNNPHIVFFGIKSDWTWIFVDPAMLFSRSFQQGNALDINAWRSPKIGCVFSSERGTLLRSSLEELIKEWCGKKVGYLEAVRGLTLYLLVQLERMEEVIPKHGSRNTVASTPDMVRLTPAFELIHSNFRSTLSIDELARVVNMSPVNFHRLFRRIMGASPHAYLTSCRLAAARNLLIRSDKTVEAVSEECGFADPSSLRKVFTKAMGVSPQRWRRGKT